MKIDIFYINVKKIDLLVNVKFNEMLLLKYRKDRYT